MSVGVRAFDCCSVPLLSPERKDTTFAHVVCTLQSQYAFDVGLLEVELLELRVQAENKSKYCHAIWLDPVLTVRRCLLGVSLEQPHAICVVAELYRLVGRWLAK